MGRKNIFIGFSKLTVSNIALMIINFLLYPVFTRIYSPEQFGELSLYLLFSFIFCAVFSLQVHLSLFKAKKEEFQGVSNQILSNSFVFGLLSLVIFALLKKPLLCLSVFGGVLMIVAEVSKIRFNRNGEFSKTVVLNLVSRIPGHIGKLSGAKFSLGGFSLVYWEIFGGIISSFYYFKNYKFDFQFMKLSAYVQKGKYFFSYSFLSFCVEEWGTFVIAKIFSSSELGIYFVFTRLVLKPVTMIGNNCASALINQLNSENNHRKISILLVGSVVFLSLISILLYGVADVIIPLVLGQNFEKVSVYISVLSFLIIPKFLKGFINVRSAQSSHRKIIIGVRLIIVLLYALFTYSMNNHLLNMLIALGIIEFVGDFMLIYFLLIRRSQGGYIKNSN